MRILQANKFFYLRGGAERYFFDLTNALRCAGHEVVSFSMRHDRNRPASSDDSFVDFVDFHAGGSLPTLARRARRFIYNPQARDRMAELVRRTRPDVAHLHNIAHQLSPSIVDALKEAGVRIIQTLHDYKLLCSSYLMYAGDAPCERCRGGRYHQILLRRCHHGSLAKSVVGFIETAWHARRGTYAAVDLFVCPSRFMMEKCVHFGVAPRRLAHLPYFLDLTRYKPRYDPGDYALYFGRLSSEKGLLTLIRAVARVREIPLLVVGEGPLELALSAEVRATGATVRMIGRLEGAKLQEAVRRSAFVVLPSECYDNLPYAVLEAYALGKPVLGSRIGGIPELVVEGCTGSLFDAGNEGALTDALAAMWSSRGRLREMGVEARAHVERGFATEHHVRRLCEIYFPR